MNLFWAFAGETVATKEEGGGVTGINRLQVVLTRYDLAAQWQCRAHNPALNIPLTANLHIDVHGTFPFYVSILMILSRILIN